MTKRWARHRRLPKLVHPQDRPREAGEAETEMALLLTAEPELPTEPASGPRSPAWPRRCPPLTSLSPLQPHKLTKLVPTSGPWHLLAPLCPDPLPRASQGCLLHSVSSHLSCPQTVPPAPVHPGSHRNPCLLTRPSHCWLSSKHTALLIYLAQGECV